MGLGLYGNGMHEFLLRELEIGTRAATFEDSEMGGWSALDDLSYAGYVAEGRRGCDGVLVATGMCKGWMNTPCGCGWQPGTEE